MSRSRVLLFLLLLVVGCDERRRGGGGGGGNNNNAGRDSGTRSDATAPIAVDGGFDDAGRPIDGGFIQADASMNNGTLDRAAFCSGLLQYICEANRDCCQGAGKYPSVEACVSELNLGWCFTGAAFDDGRAVFDGVAAARVLAEFRDLSARCLVFNEDVAPVRGTVRAGGDCSTPSGDQSGNYACVEGTYCSGSEGAQAATCQNYLGLGQPCSGGRCAPGTDCNPSTLVCRAGQPTGASCGETAGVCAEGSCVDGFCSNQLMMWDYCLGE